MFKHIVAFKLKDQNKEEFMVQIKKDLEDLCNTVESLRLMEVGINLIKDSSMPDLVLTSVFDDQQGFEDYKIHPKHVIVVNKMKEMVISRHVIDYTV